jgi:hypothetical protein
VCSDREVNVIEVNVIECNGIDVDGIDVNGVVVKNKKFHRECHNGEKIKNGVQIKFNK